MNRRTASVVLSTHPIMISLAYLCAHWASGAWLNSDTDGAVWMATTVMAVAVAWVVWLWALCYAARIAVNARGAKLDREFDAPFLASLVAIGAICVGVLLDRAGYFGRTGEEVALFAGTVLGLSSAIGAWQTAQHLDNASYGPTRPLQTIGTFVLLLYLLVGIWVLWSRIRAVAKIV